jgi:hypothetical protein
MGGPYLGPEGGRPGRPTQVVRHACSGNLGIVQLLRYIRSAMYTAFFGRKMAPLANGALCLSTMVNPALRSYDMIFHLIFPFDVLSIKIHMV